MRNATSEKNKKQRKLGESQLYILQMVNPEWPTKYPDSRSLRVLESLRKRKMAYENFGRWYIDAAGVEALKLNENR